MCTPSMWMEFLMSADNERRRQAEADINGRPPSEVAKFLLRYIMYDPDDGNRAMAAILLHNLLKSGQVDKVAQKEIRVELLVCVPIERVKRIKKTLCDTVAELAAFSSQQDQWPELLSVLLTWVESDNSRWKESALSILARVSQYIGGELRPHWHTLHIFFHDCLCPPAPPEMRIAALEATTNFLLTIETPQKMERFQDLLPDMMQILTKAVNHNEEITVQESLEMFLQLAGTKPWFLRKQQVQVVSYMLQIAETESVEEDTRHLALEIIITLAEAKELVCGMKKELPKFIGRLFVFLMKMLLDIDDDPEDEVAVMSDNYNVGHDSLSRLAISLRGNLLGPLPCKLFDAYLEDPDWRKRHAALITLAQIAKGCAKPMIKKQGRTRVVDITEQIVKMVTNSLEDPNPHVRWAAIFATTRLSLELRSAFKWLLKPQLGKMAAQQNPHLQAILINLEHLVNKVLKSLLSTNSRLRCAAIFTIDQLSQKLNPYFQWQCHQQVLPALIGAMNNFQNPPEQADAAALAMVRFIRGCERGHVRAHLPGIAEFLSCLQDKPVLYQEERKKRKRKRQYLRKRKRQ